MGNFLKKISDKFNKKITCTPVAKVDTSILNQRPDILLSDLGNLWYSISAIGGTQAFMYNSKPFEQQNPYNRVSMYGDFFEDLYNDYFERLTCKIKNWRLPSSGYFHNYPWEDSDVSLYKRDARPYISDGAYKKMPKRYRGVFKKYNSIAYVLNIHAAPYKIFIVRPENRPEMESLLLKMAELLDAQNPISRIRRCFVKDSSPDANKVTKEQIDAIKELYDICVKLNNITEPGFKRSFSHAGENHKKRHGAIDIYNEYIVEQSRKNHYLELQKQLHNAELKRELKRQAAVSEYNTTRSIILADAKKQITK